MGFRGPEIVGYVVLQLVNFAAHEIGGLYF